MSGLRLVTITFPTIKNQNKKLIGKKQSKIIANQKSNSSPGLAKNNEEQVKSNSNLVTNRRRSEVPNRPASTLGNVNLQEKLLEVRGDKRSAQILPATDAGKLLRRWA